MNDSRMSGLGASPSQYFARQRIESLVNVPRLFAAIDADPGIVGAGVVYIDADYNVVTLREFRPICSVLTKRVVLREVKRYLAPAQYLEQLSSDPREPRVFERLLGTAATCVSTYISWRVLYSGSIAVAFGGPVGMAIGAVSITALWAGAGLCFVAGGRTAIEVVNPEWNDFLDDLVAMRVVESLLETVSLMGAATASMNIVKFLQIRKAATGRGWFDLFRGLSRQQRKRLTAELLSIKHPSLTAKQIKLQQRLGTLPKQFTPAEIQHSTITLIKDALGVVLGVGSSSSVQTIAFGLYEEVEE
ncbi:NAD synthetase [Pseudomonas sp. SBB6]|uniref:NAD synthetase n=1 Tax=Pseudomonas sp. SBB6 TaxID=2962032 RepID=UPI0020B8C81E|nr:NAD synthetase [Pseudomonas sp. SBB6]MCP3748982.1 NAD synthetase [Pseudomonas sp. SBB6]